jgi:hypothetical protein
METVCRIEIIKDGIDFSVRVYLASGSIKEYQNQVFEEVHTEMVVDLQELLEE